MDLGVGIRKGLGVEKESDASGRRRDTVFDGGREGGKGMSGTAGDTLLYLASIKSRMAYGTRIGQGREGKGGRK